MNMNIRNLILVALIASATTGCAALGSLLSSNEEVTIGAALPSRVFHFKDGGEAAFYVLGLGDEAFHDTVIFFVSGSGCSSIKYRLDSYFAPIRDSMNATVFALQKRAIDEENRAGRFCSSAFHTTDYIGQTLADQQEFVEVQLAKLPFEPKAVVLLGASEGTIIVSRLAATAPRITHVGLVGNGGATMRENLEALSRSSWYLRNHESVFSAIAREPDNIDRKVWGHSYKYWASILDINIGDDLIRLDIPIIVAMGEKDNSVPVDSARRLRDRFRQAGKTNLRLLICPNANHRLEDRENGKSCVGDFLSALRDAAQGVAMPGDGGGE
ncbi:MAG: prolyl oligopeptidase family serine peptidase [Azoarcus sp.]|jgi:pimeloyl-ACP methyl ester carboxylesterase|nr:prolyl oligopeptidase family serine peptidase [Azoarcus sp.]